MLEFCKRRHYLRLDRDDVNLQGNIDPSYLNRQGLPRQPCYSRSPSPSTEATPAQSDQHTPLTLAHTVATLASARGSFPVLDEPIPRNIAPTLLRISENVPSL